MKKQWMVLAVLPIVAATAMAAGMQESKHAGLKRVVVDDARDDHEAFDAAAWKKKLAANDLAQREKAFEELADLARRDPDARRAVESWADDKDGELAWTSRLLRREIERSSDPFHRGPGNGGPGNGGSGNGGSGNRGQLYGWQPGPNFGGFDWDDFSRRFDDLDSMFGDLREEWGNMLRNMPSTSGNAKSSTKSFSLETGKDGVTCKVTEEVDGKKVEHTYEAKSMEELLDAHPELRDNLGGARFRWFQGSPGGGMLLTPHEGGVTVIPPRGSRLFRLDDGTDADGNPRTDRLGISCGQVAKDRAKDLGIDAGVGLEVMDVAPGSIASLLGLRAGDIVTEINGTTIRSADDVKKVLADRAKDGEVAVVVLGQDGDRRTMSWKPTASDAPEKSLEKSSGKKRGSRDL
jgi:hypothetical protein